ncbi:MAG: alpha/beta hydrolase [Clostridia bacterium]|nr:alpha/beta hydrolase [Clostridia bacterium]
MERFDLWENTPGLCREVPGLTYYPAKNKTSDAAIIILPGGGYACRADHEGQGYAEYLNEHGFDAFVCDYRVSPHRFPLPLLDVRRAVRYVRYYADKFGINKDKICVMGSSAGGGLTSMVSTYMEKLEYEGVDAIDDEGFVPNGQILCYGYICHATKGLLLDWANRELMGEDWKKIAEAISAEQNVTPHTPKAFIWNTSEDDCVDMRHALTYATQLRQNGVPVEMHILPYGGHGLGIPKDNPHVAQWAELLVNWLRLEF